MLFDGFIQRKLASLIRPWLAQEPVWEVKLGFRRSRVVARNLRLDAAVLNRLVDGGDELRLLFKSVTIDEVVFRITHWSAPAFSVDVRGVNVTLHIEKGAMSMSKRVDESLDDYLEERKRKILAQIDPHGSALHESIENMMIAASSKTRLKDSITNLILAHCCLHLYDARVRVEYPVLDDKFSWLFYTRELSAESEHEKMGCLFGGLIGLLFIPFRETSFNLEASELEIGAENKSHSSCILSCVNPCVGIGMKDLHLVNFVLSLPEMNFSFSPSQIQMFLAFSYLFNSERKSIRSGRLLWDIARSKVHNGCLPPRFLLYKMVPAAVLWLRLVKEYQAFLELVGYPKHGIKIQTGLKLPRAADQLWQRISQKEKAELPVEAVASARLVARHRAALKATSTEEYGLSPMNNESNSFWRIFLPLFVIWWATLNMFEIFRTFVLLRMRPSIVDRSKMTCTVVDPRRCFHLSMGKVSAIFSLDDGSLISRKTNSMRRTSNTNMISFFLLAKGLHCTYEEGICEQYTSSSIGFLKVTSATVSRGSKQETRSRSNQNLIMNSEENQAESKAIAWGEPALMSCRPEVGEIGRGAIPNLKGLSGEMELAWNRMRSRSRGRRNHYDGSPWAIFGMHTYLSYEDIKSPDFGLSKCGLMVGKLNFALGHSTVLSIATVVEQVQCALNQFKGPLHTSRNLRRISVQEINGPATTFEGLKKKLFNVLPDKHVEVRAAVAGLRAQVSLKSEVLSGPIAESSDVHVSDKANFIIDVYSTYFAVRPTTMPGIAPGEHQRLSNEFGSEFFKLQENMIDGLLELGNVEYASRGQIIHCCDLVLGGLSAYLENVVENDPLQVLLLKPVTAKFPSIRDYLYSFGRSVVASSLSLHGVLSGASGLFYMDEMSVISQVLESLFKVASATVSGHSDFSAAQNDQVLDHQNLQTEFVNEDILTATSEGATLTSESCLFSISANIELVPFDLCVYNSRNVTEKSSLLLDAYNNIRTLGLAEPSTGIWLSVQRTCIDIYVSEDKVEVDATFGGFHAVLYKYKNQTGKADKSAIKIPVMGSVDCLYEASVSSCSFSLLLDSLGDSDALGRADSLASNENCRVSLSGRPLIANSRSLNLDHIQDDGFDSDVSDVAPSNWLLLNITVGVIFMGTGSVKNDVIGANVADKLQLSVSVGGKFQSVLMEIQGGSVVFDMLVLATFAHCLTSYLDIATAFLSIKQSLRKSSNMAERSISESCSMEHSEESSERNISPAYAVGWELLEAFTVDLSHFSLILLSQDESGMLREIIGTVGFRLKSWLENRKPKFLFNISHMKILSQNLTGGMGERERSNRLSRVSSQGSSYDFVSSNHENSPGAILCREKAFVLSKDASCSELPASTERSSVTDLPSPLIQVTGNCILEQLSTSISAEKLFLVFEDGQSGVAHGWVGHGSVSGLNLTISLSEIKMLLAVVESLSEVFGNRAANNVVEKTWSSVDQKFENNLETALPEGAIVTIEDVHQHMYVTVEGIESKYRVAGEVHYSVAGKRALFRVKWHKQRKWMFSTSWFSLESLYAKTNSGDPLCLSYSTSSSFVDISSSNNSSCALWKIASPKLEDHEDDNDLRPLSYLSRNTFYLVNKKNDCAAAFVHGAFEFVRKPGNPFKFKIFHNFSLTPDMMTSERHLLSASDHMPADAQNISDQVQLVPCINLSIQKVSLTVVDELSEAMDKFPLLQGSIDDTKLTVQVLPQKTRVISTFTTMLYYFDANKYLWKELVQPIEMCIYWRSTSHLPVAGKPSHGMLSRLYFRMQELNLSLSELSLDILLYLIGKLDLAGPFAVKSSTILSSCCKVVNQLELDLLCQFENSQSARVARKQSALFFVRPLVDQPLESPYVTISLAVPGTSSTSSVHVPLGESKVFAWRTRIKSLQDTQTSPGSLVVFDISKNVEEGLSLTISPLLRIHNQTGFPVELRIQRADLTEVEFASVRLKEGDTFDDCVAAFDAMSLVGGPKKALRSFGVGNFVFSFKPEINEAVKQSCNTSVDWSENLEGGKAVRLSGVIDKFNYQFRKALSADSRKRSFSTAGCSVISGNAHVTKMHFLVQSIARDVPIMKPDDLRKRKISSIALQEQKEIIFLPTVRVSNLLESDIDVLLTETETLVDGLPNINQATIPYGLTVNLYATPAVIFFTITLTMFGSSCKPVNCGHWLKKLNKKKDGIQFLDIDLEFPQGQYFAYLRLARSKRGMLEAIVFTRYTLRNDSEFLLFCSKPNLKPLARDQIERRSVTTPHLGSLLPPKSIRSWFIKSSKLSVTLYDETSTESALDLDALSGRSEMIFTKHQRSGSTQLIKLGISLGPLMSKVDVPAQVVSIVPRYVVSNESEEQIFVRQCFLQDDFGETLSIGSKQKTALCLRVGSHDKQDANIFDKLLQKHKVLDEDFSIFVQFKPTETMLGWSGPVCVASLGRFFLKFKRSVESSMDQSDYEMPKYDTPWEFAAVHVVEEASTFVLNFYKPPDIALPYRIENHLLDASITYYQKDTFEPETLASRASVYYVWDDFTRPRKLVVKINGVEMLREISLDKLRPWKPFFRIRQQGALAFKLPSDSRSSLYRATNTLLMNGVDLENLGYEVRASGPTRVLRICRSPGSRVGDRSFHSCKMIQLRISYFAIRLFEPFQGDLSEDVDSNDQSTYTPIIAGRLVNTSFDSVILDQRMYNQFRVQSIDIDDKWAGAPFAAMLRRHFTPGDVADDSILFVVFVLFPTSSNVREVKYSSIVLQPIDLNLDEETLMKIVPFWRISLSTNNQSQQYYFDHFEIHPVKITASFIPEDSYSSYSSGQEALRSLLHSVIKIPTVKNVAVELNGVLVNHALVTTRELLLRCARHYSWYAMRAVYIAKGSLLLPPSFASVFDDLASSSLDVFFDPSSSLFNVRGLTLGTFKLISKCIENKGASGTRRYFGDLSKTLKNAGSNILFAAVTEVTDSVLKGAESSGLNGMVTGFHHGILKLAMEPSLLGTALMEGGPDRKIKLDRSPGVDELYIEGYLQAMLDTIYKQEYLRVRVIDDQVILKNLPPNSSLIGEIMDRVKDFLVSKALIKGDYSTMSRPLRHLRGENEWRIGPTVLTLCEHLFVSFAIRMLRKQTNNAIGKLKLKDKSVGTHGEIKPSSSEASTSEEPRSPFIWRWGVSKFVLSAAVAYIDGRLCRCIPNPVARRIVSGFLLTFLDNNDAI